MLLTSTHRRINTVFCPFLDQCGAFDRENEEGYPERSGAEVMSQSVHLNNTFLACDMYFRFLNYLIII